MVGFLRNLRYNKAKIRIYFVSSVYFLLILGLCKSYFSKSPPLLPQVQKRKACIAVLPPYTPYGVCLSCGLFAFSVFYKAVSRHFFGLLQSHDVQYARSNVGKYSVFYRSVFIVADINERNRVERMLGIGSAVFVERVIGVAVVCNYYSVISVSTTSFTQASTATTAFSIAL